MTDLGQTLKEARVAAGISLSGMAKRTGFSRSHLGNVETGTRTATTEVVMAYERALGDDVQRRLLLLSAVAVTTGVPVPDTAVGIAADIQRGRKELLTGMQTTHQTDRAIAGLVSRHAGPSASLVKWSRRGGTLLRVNATGILAKIGSPTLDNEAITVLHCDGDVRELYLTAVLARVLNLPWDTAARMATTGQGAATPEHVRALSAELTNPADSGARWCATLTLHRSRKDDPAGVTAALMRALRSEPSREALRAIGAALAGEDPLTI